MMEDWEKMKIENLVLNTKLKDPNKHPDETFKYIDVSAVSNTLFKIDNYVILLGKEAPSRARKLINFQDIIFATVRPTLMRIALVPKELDGEVCSTGYCVLKPNEKIDPQFLYYSVLTDFFIEKISKLQKGASYPAIRDSDLKNQIITLPPLPEQRKIAHVLTTVQKAIEQQDNLIRTTTELKKALMQKLFTEGTRGEAQKETEIGMVPESWEVVKLGDCLLQTQYGLSTKGNDVGEVPILRMTNQKDGYISGDNLQYVNISEKELNKFKVNVGDVIFNRTNSFELVGRTAIFNLAGNYVFASYLIRLITNPEKLYPEFLNLYLNADETQNRLKSIATRGVSQSNISATRLSGFVMLLPSLAEQKQIISTIKAFNVKINCNEKKKQTLTDLFKTLLHELMSGQRRAHELELEEYSSKSI